MGGVQLQKFLQVTVGPFRVLVLVGRIHGQPQQTGPVGELRGGARHRGGLVQENGSLRVILPLVIHAALGVIRQEGAGRPQRAQVGKGLGIVEAVLPAGQRQVLEQHRIGIAFLQQQLVLPRRAGVVAGGVTELAQQHAGFGVLREIIQELAVLLRREIVKANGLVHAAEVIEGARVGQAQ